MYPTRMQGVYISKNTKTTGRLAHKLLHVFAERKNRKGALVVGLVGDLGVGKTTFTQAIARVLGVHENVLSPTFVLMKVYRVKRHFKHLVHIDCYRLDSPSDLVHLGFHDIMKDTDAVVLIEWAERVRKILPKETVWINLRHGKKQNERIITLT